MSKTSRRHHYGPDWPRTFDYAGWLRAQQGKLSQQFAALSVSPPSRQLALLGLPPGEPIGARRWRSADTPAYDPHAMVFIAGHRHHPYRASTK